MSITVYTTPSCGWCDKLRAHLKKKKLDFKEVNILEDPQARTHLIENTGQMAVPVTMVQEKFVVGFEKTQIENLLK